MQACILIVDDDIYVREVLTRVVQTMGHTALGAASGQAALDLLSDPDTPTVDLMMTDIMMPLMNGVELLEKVHGMHPSIPIAIITGAPTLDNSIAALNAGAYAYLTKPVSSEQVRDVVGKGLKLSENSRAQQMMATELVGRYRALEDQLTALQETQHRMSDSTMNSFEGLIRGLRHELGNATTAIKLNLSVLEEAGGNSIILNEHLLDLEASADELASLVARLKEYPRQHAIRDIVDLREAMTSLTESAYDQVKSSNLELDLLMSDDDMFVYGTDVEIIRACKHILNNAVEATLAAGGHRIEIVVGMVQNAVTITFSDEGPGFPLEMEEKLFSPGFTTKITQGVVRGLGLGLFIARATVNLYGGQIRLENRLGGGASVHIQWPAAGPLDELSFLSSKLADN